jgi:hypothetical protein
MRDVMSTTASVAAEGFYRTRRSLFAPSPLGAQVRHVADRFDERMQFSVTPNGVHVDYQRRPMSNTERQRWFRASHPGYYQRLHAKRRAAVREMTAVREFATAFATQMLGVPVHRALPAPVETIAIPGVNAIPAIREATRERVAVR